MMGDIFIMIGVALIAFACGTGAAWTISKTVIQFIEDMHEQKTKSVGDQARIDALESKNEVQAVRLMIKEIEDLHREEISMYQDRVADLEAEVEKERAMSSEQVVTLRKQLNRMKKRHKRATKLYNEERKVTETNAGLEEAIEAKYKLKVRELEQRIDILVAEALGFQLVVQQSDFEANRLSQQIIVEREKNYEKLEEQNTAYQTQLYRVTQAFQDEKTALHKKIKRINRRRKVASKIHMNVLGVKNNYASGLSKENKVLKQKLEAAADIITSLRNTR